MRKPPAILYVIKISEIARICGVSLKTVQRWKAGQTVPHKTAIEVLTRDLGCFHPRWSGWTINDQGELCSPENWIATPGDVLAIQLTQLQLGDYRRENRALKQALEDMDSELYLQEFEEQPAPDQWEFKVG